MCQWKWKSDPCELWTCEPTTELLKKWCTILACSGLQSRGIRRKRRQRAWQHGISLWKIQSCRISWCPWIQIIPQRKGSENAYPSCIRGLSWLCSHAVQSEMFYEMLRRAAVAHCLAQLVGIRSAISPGTRCADIHCLISQIVRC